MRPSPHSSASVCAGACQSKLGCVWCIHMQSTNCRHLFICRTDLASDPSLSSMSLSLQSSAALSSSSTAEAASPTSTSGWSERPSTPAGSAASSTASTSGSEGGKAPVAAEATYTGESISIDATNLKDYLGQPPFAKDRFYDVTPPGVRPALA